MLVVTSGAVTALAERAVASATVKVGHQKRRKLGPIRKKLNPRTAVPRASALQKTKAIGSVPQANVLFVKTQTTKL